MEIPSPFLAGLAAGLLYTAIVLLDSNFLLGGLGIALLAIGQANSEA